VTVLGQVEGYGLKGRLCRPVERDEIGANGVSVRPFQVRRRSRRRRRLLHRAPHRMLYRGDGVDVVLVFLRRRRPRAPRRPPSRRRHLRPLLLQGLRCTVNRVFLRIR
jgi:hypothetical protein